MARTGPSWKRWRLVGSVMGLVLFVAAVWLVVSHASDVSSAVAAIGHPDPITVLWLVGTVLVTVVLSAAGQIIMLRRFSTQHVGMGEMSALVCVATVLNYLPMWPGVFGRMAWHRVVNQIPVMDSGKAIVSARLIGLMTGLLMLVLVWADGPLLGDLDLRWAWLIMAGSLAVPSVIAPLRLVAWTAVIRWCDLYIVYLQYLLAFRLLGVEIDPATGMALAGIGSVATSVPFIGSGPGLREWAVGWMTTQVAKLPDALVLGVMTDLVRRVVTLLVMLPLAGVSVLWLRRRLRAVQSCDGSMPRSSTVKSESKT